MVTSFYDWSGIPQKVAAIGASSRSSWEGALRGTLGILDRTVRRGYVRTCEGRGRGHHSPAVRRRVGRSGPPPASRATAGAGWWSRTTPPTAACGATARATGCGSSPRSAATTSSTRRRGPRSSSRTSRRSSPCPTGGRWPSGRARRRRGCAACCSRRPRSWSPGWHRSTPGSPTRSGSLPTSSTWRAPAWSGSQLRWFQRGVPSAGAPSASVDVALDSLLEAAAGDARRGPVAGVRRYDLGRVGGVPLAVTDAVALSDGRVLVWAAAEDSPSTYDDGPVVGSALALLDGDRVLDLVEQPLLDGGWPRSRGWRCAGYRDDVLDLVAVVDADDPAVPSLLLELAVTPGAELAEDAAHAKEEPGPFSSTTPVGLHDPCSLLVGLDERRRSGPEVAVDHDRGAGGAERALQDRHGRAVRRHARGLRSGSWRPKSRRPEAGVSPVGVRRARPSKPSAILLTAALVCGP